ncbi:MAG TPA: cytochrome c [Actinomycetes bacterium]|nr:cytochrome c [Actinomycetes bacterium]
METRRLVLVILLPTALVLLTGLIVGLSFARQRARTTGIPPSRRPGPTDEGLEGPVLERFQLWGLVLTAFLAIFLPALYLREPARQAQAAEKELEISREHGKATFEQFCARCHGPDAHGGTVKRFKDPNNPKAPPSDRQAPDLTRIYERHPGESVAQVARTTINGGRPGTPMPAWGIRNNGPMNDQQIINLVNYLLSIQADGKERQPLEFKAGGPGGPPAGGRAVAAPSDLRAR